VGNVVTNIPLPKAVSVGKGLFGSWQPYLSLTHALDSCCPAQRNLLIFAAYIRLLISNEVTSQSLSTCIPFPNVKIWDLESLLETASSFRPPSCQLLTSRLAKQIHSISPQTLSGSITARLLPISSREGASLKPAFWSAKTSELLRVAWAMRMP
jgi:hypothetical protein